MRLVMVKQRINMNKQLLEQYKHLTEARNKINPNIRYYLELVLGDYYARLRRTLKNTGTLDFGPTEKTLLVNGQSLKAGKALRKFIPTLTDTELNQVLGKIKLYFSGEDDVEWELIDDVSKGYRDCYTRGGISSCMSIKPHLTKFYKSIGAKLLTAKSAITGKYVGRAVIWFTTKDEKGTIIPLMDRIYPPFDNKVVESFRKYADKEEWAIRTSTRADTSNIKHKGKLIYLYQDVSDYNDYLPWMDTLEYLERGDFITNNNDSWTARVRRVAGTHSRTGNSPY